MAGLDRGVRPMGDWSMLTTLSTLEMPSMESQSPGRSRARYRVWASFLYRISYIRVLLPLPDTPVMQTSLPSGISTSMFRRLFWRAPRMVMDLPLPSRRSFGTGIRLNPPRYCPVSDSGAAMMSSTGPSATMCPPCSPAPGPRSTIWSAARIMASSCSTIRTVLPMSRRFWRVLIRR